MYRKWWVWSLPTAAHRREIPGSLHLLSLWTPHLLIPYFIQLGIVGIAFVTAPLHTPPRQMPGHHSQKAGHNPWLTSGTHSLLGGQGHGCKETAQRFPLRPGIEPGASRLWAERANHCTTEYPCMRLALCPWLCPGGYLLSITCDAQYNKHMITS